MSEPEAYLFSQRNRQEAHRLENQHSLLKKFCGGRLLHHAIPLDKVQNAIADVGTGTGVWIRDIAKSFEGPPNPRLVGFDISPAQFPSQKTPNIEFVVQDILNPFPVEYHGKFDLVHVRLLVCALQKESLREAVKNIVAILPFGGEVKLTCSSSIAEGPGGYLQWQEADPNGRICAPPSAVKDAVITTINIERAARGLTLNIYPSMLKSILSLSLADESEVLDAPMCITDVMRILNFELHRTDIPALANIRLEKNAWAFTVLKQMILAGVRRKLNEAKRLITISRYRAEKIYTSGEVENNVHFIQLNGNVKSEVQELATDPKIEIETEKSIGHANMGNTADGIVNGSLKDEAEKVVIDAKFGHETVNLELNGGVRHEPKESLQYQKNQNGPDHENGETNNKVRDSLRTLETTEGIESEKEVPMTNGRTIDRGTSEIWNHSNGDLEENAEKGTKDGPATNVSTENRPNGSSTNVKVQNELNGTAAREKEAMEVGLVVKDEVNKNIDDAARGLKEKRSVNIEPNGLAPIMEATCEANGEDRVEVRATELVRQAEEAISLIEQFGHDLAEGAYDINATLAWLVAQKTPFTD